MTKSRKKNYKLRRRVKRTTASIIMVMAVVVAAIPVENYGTMQASGIADGTDLQSKANSYLETAANKYNASSYENKYSGATKTVQHIEGDAFIDAYEIKLGSGNGAMIARSVFARDRDQFDIYETEYYDYVQMDDEYLTAVYNAFDAEEYKLAYSTDSKAYSSRTVNLTDADGNTTDTLTFTAVTAQTIDTNAQGSVENRVTPSTSISYTDSTGVNTYTKVNQTQPGALEILEDYAPNLLDSHTQSITTYNTEMRRYTDVLDRISAKNDADITASDETDWNNAVSEINRLNATVSNLTAFSATFGTIRANESGVDDNQNSLQDIIDYTICQRLSDGNNDLKRYELIKLNSETGDIVYVPVNISGQGPTGSQVNDGAGYLAMGSVEIKGIGSNAFDPLVDHTADDRGEIGTLTIPASVEFIGASAFANSNYLKDVTIDDSNCDILGDEAFSGCVNLRAVRFTSANSKLRTIGCKAFYNTSLSDIVFPEYVNLIGAGCLYYSGIQSMTMGGLRNGTLTIEPYAFFGCDKLSQVIFAGESTNFEMGEGAFALTAGQDGGALRDFAFPSYMNQMQYAAGENDYILAGRENLKTVTFPGRLGNGADGMIPDHTLAGCTQLDCVYFPDGAYNAEFDPGKLFSEVLNNQFYVEGPATGASSSTKARPRTLTWNAVPGYYTEDGKQGVIPYKFTDSNGETHIEIGVGEENRDDYIATIDILDENAKTAVLSNYLENHRSEFGSIAVVIPEKVGEYTIKEIADGCFRDVKDIIYKVVIADSTVERINANAFKDCSKLQWVELGDSVNYIGSSAFENCTSLENVVFSQTQTSLFGDEDSYWSDALTIEKDAFKTGSDYLIFHGAVHPEYAPYKLAMSDESKSMTGTSLQICYKTDAPMNLTILRDNTSGESTLIDYPHYEEIDTINKSLIEKWANGDSGYSITDKFEEWNELRKTNNYTDRPYNSEGYYSEEDIPLYTLFMTIPKGIDSIDAKGYFNNTDNASDIAYLDRTYTPQTRTSTKGNEVEIAIDGSNNAPRAINQKQSYSRYGDVKSIYSNKDYVAGSDLDEFGLTPGLFSGFLAEADLSSAAGEIPDAIPGILWRTYNGHQYVENSIIGNDYLTSIDLTSVKSLPDYAFISCENLLTTSYGAEMEKIGVLPYRNCKSLSQINIPAGNPYVLFDNMILYRKNQSNERAVSGLEIIQCLEGRGNPNTGSSSFKVGEGSGDAYLADVVSIDKEAFSYCDNITEVDLSTSSITTLPERCFYKAEKLDTVILPDTIEVIGEEAFLETNSNRIEVTIPNPQCAIGETAFDLASGQFVTIRGPKYDSTGTRQSAIYNYYLKMKEKYDNIEFIGEDYHKVTFIDYDTSLIVDSQITNPQYVEHGADAICVSKPQRTGYEFSSWKCILADGTQYTGTTDPWINVTEDRIIQAVYKPNANIVVSDGVDYTLTIENGTANGSTGSITAKGGDRIVVIAETRTNGSTFQYWTVNPSTYTNLIVDGVSAKSTTFIMPNDNVTLTANFSAASNGGNDGGNGGGSDDGNGSGNGSGSTDSSKKYKVTVNYGTGSGEYSAGETVTITANAPDTSSKVFSKWTTATSGVGFASATSVTTTFVMPASDVTVTANYKTRTSDDDDDDDRGSSSGRPGSGTTTTTVSNRPSSSTSTTGTTGTVTNSSSGTGSSSTGSDGSKIYITKNGISNKDVASVSVEGSTDNFIVKITESEEATAAVKEALTNKYGSLDGLAYFPMDISLYDSTGQNKITDTYGLNITVTMPIPDVLIQYGGNARVAAADNGNLQELTPRFTTIDGIACISFVPPHFSPYVIYVDTHNLIAGQTLDSTPSTGDPIHPKWFAAIGMACISIILFVTSDGSKRRKFKTA